MKNEYFEKIKNARVYDVAEKTALEYQPNLSSTSEQSYFAKT